MFRRRIFVVIVFISLLCFAGSAFAQIRDDLEIIEWPSREYPTIQSAIDALPGDGGVLEIAEGEHLIDEPIYIIGKKIAIKGAGSGLTIKRKKVTKRKRQYPDQFFVFH